MLFWAIIIGGALALYFIVLRPLLPILFLKVKYGNQAVIHFFPVIGEYFYTFNAERKYGDTAIYYREFIKRHPEAKIILSNFMCSPFMMFLDPRYFKEMLMQHQHYTTVSIYNHADIWDGGLVASHGESWKQKRKVVAPYFLYENLQKRAAYLNAIMQERFDAEFSNLSPEGRVIDMYQFATQISGEAMIRTFFGNQITEFQGKPASLFIVDLFRDLSYNAIHGLWFNIRYIFLGQRAWTVMPNALQRSINERIRLLRDESRGVVQQRVALKLEQQRTKQPWDSHDFVDQLINQSLDVDNPQPLDMTFVLQSFIGFFQAGTDTTAHSIVGLLVALAQNPELQTELRREINKNVPNPAQLDSAQLSSLKYTHAFMQEAQRVHNAVVTLLPRKALNTHQVADLRIHKGWYVNCYLQFALKNPKFYHDPDRFDPNRWLKNPSTGSDGDQQYTFLAFSGGPRNCLGQHLAVMEQKIFLVHFLKRFQVTLTGQPAAMKFGSLLQFARSDLVRITAI